MKKYSKPRNERGGGERMNKKLLAAIVVTLTLIMVVTPLVGSAQAWGWSRTQFIKIQDNTQDGLQPTDPVIGYAIFKQDRRGMLRLTIILKRAIPNAEFEVEFVTRIENPIGGLDENGHGGYNNYIGDISTNRWGCGYACFVIDPETDLYIGYPWVVPGETNYAHIDVEGGGTEQNQYGGAVLYWEQPAQPP